MRIDKRGKFLFDRVYVNVKLLVKCYFDYFKCKVYFNFVLNYYFDIEEVYWFIYGEFNKVFGIEMIIYFGIKLDKLKLF